jgi:uncharacterized membrane protein
MKATKTTVDKKHFKKLYWVEIIAVASAVAGYLLENMTIVGLALGLLSTIFFLYSTNPDSLNPDQPGGKMGFKDLLLLVIMPKVAFIGCSIATVGILFSISGMNGSHLMLSMGTMVVVVATAVLAFLFVATNAKTSILPVLARALPVMGVGLYLLM